MPRANRVPSDFESDPRMARRLRELLAECRSQRRSANGIDIARALRAEGFRVSDRTVRRELMERRKGTDGPPVRKG